MISWARKLYYRRRLKQQPSLVLTMSAAFLRTLPLKRQPFTARALATHLLCNLPDRLSITGPYPSTDALRTPLKSKVGSN